MFKAAQERLSPRRFHHSLGFTHTAMALASHWGQDVHAAAVVGILHDLAKETPAQEIRADLLKRGHVIEPEDEPYPGVWHGLASAVWAHEDFQVDDPPTLEAIRYHATAEAGACLLTRIAVIADMTEPMRTWPALDELRRLSFKDFDAAFAVTMRMKMQHLLDRKKSIHPRALRALEAFGAPAEILVEEKIHGQG